MAMDQKETTYHYLTNPVENMSFEALLKHLQKYIEPSDFYNSLQTIVKEEKQFFSALPKSDKTGDIYNRRIKEIAVLEEMLVNTLNKSTFLIYMALKKEQKPLTPDNYQSELLDDDDNSEESINLTECTIIYNDDFSDSERRIDYFSDDSDLYNLCVEIVNKTEKPLYSPFLYTLSVHDKHTLISKIENLLLNVQNNKVTMYNHQKHLNKLKDFLILDMRKSIQELEIKKAEQNALTETDEITLTVLKNQLKTISDLLGIPKIPKSNIYQKKSEKVLLETLVVTETLNERLEELESACIEFQYLASFSESSSESSSDLSSYSISPEKSDLQSSKFDEPNSNKLLNIPKKANSTGIQKNTAALILNTIFSSPRNSPPRENSFQRKLSEKSITNSPNVDEKPNNNLTIAINTHEKNHSPQHTRSEKNSTSSRKKNWDNNWGYIPPYSSLTKNNSARNDNSRTNHKETCGPSPKNGSVKYY